MPNSFETVTIEPPHYSGNSHEKPMPAFSEDFFYLVGRWIGDGWVRDNQRSGRPKGQMNAQIVICAGYEKEDALKAAVEAVIDRYNVERCRTAVKYKFCGRVFCNWLTENFGKYAYRKRIPAWVYSMSDEWRLALFKGICDTDGYLTKSGHIKITTVSKKLAHGIRLLAETLGYSSTVYFDKRPSTCVIEGRTVNQRNTYTLNLVHSKTRKRLADELHTWYRVQSVRETGESKTVYNLTVEDDNSYIADDFVVHNCQGLSLAGKRKGLKDERSGLYMEAVRIVKEMLEATNGEYPKFCVFENVFGLLSSANGEDFITCLDMMQELGFLPDANILDAQFMGVPQRRKRVFITWVQVDYILRKRTPLSDSITLQLLTEILQMNLAGLLRAYGIEPKKSAAQRFLNVEDGLKKRMNLFSLQKDDRLQMLQRHLEEIKATLLNGQSGSDSNHRNDRTAKTTSTAEVTKSEDSTTESQSWSIGQLLKSALDDGLQIENGFITSTWTRETIARKICTYFQALLNTLDVTTRLMLSLEKEPMSLNCFEWVQYVLTETREFIDETKKYERSSGQVVWHDNLRTYEQELQNKGEQIERYFAENCGCEVLSESKSLPWNYPQSSSQRQAITGNPTRSTGETGSGDEIVLNDQGGQRYDISTGVMPTLRAQTHGHPPCVMDEGAAGFCTEHSANSRSIGYEEERSPTLRAGVVPAVVPLDNHPQDSRIKIEEDGKVQTLSNRMGTGGNNVPLLMEEQVPITMKIRCGGGAGGKGQLCQRDKSATLGCNNDQTLFVPEANDVPDDKPCYWDGSQTAGTLTNRNASGCQRMPDKQHFNCVLEPQASDTPKPQAFGISSFKSNAMLSDNPHAGIYEAETSWTLDCNGGSPVQNQGGIAIVEQEPTAFAQNQRNEVRDLGDKSGALQAEPGMKQQTYVLQGNMIGRSDKNGPQGCGVSEDVCYTLTDVDRHAVAAPEINPVYAMSTGYWQEVVENKSPTLKARDYKDPTTVAPVPIDESPSYGIDRAAFNQGQNAKFGFSVEEELSPTLVSRGPNAVSKSENTVKNPTNPETHYTVRRLTPTECARLQGMPDWWCDDLGNPNPTDEELAFWKDVWETYRHVVSHTSKPKTEKQIRKWLANPYSDSAVYRLYGNGVALPCVYFIMCGIVWAAGKEQEEQ